MRINGFFFCLVMVAMAYGGNVSAHAVVTEHSLKIERPKANQAKQVELTFNSKVELGLSQVYLISKGEKNTLLQLSNGTKQGSVLVDVPPLSSGEYALLYKIFAADGHITEDAIHFFVTP